MIYNDLPFLPKRMKIEKVEKLQPTYTIRIWYTHTKFKTSIKSWIRIGKSLVAKFNQKAWLKPNIGINKKLRKIFKKMISKKIFSS